MLDSAWRSWFRLNSHGPFGSPPQVCPSQRFSPSLKAGSFTAQVNLASGIWLQNRSPCSDCSISLKRDSAQYSNDLILIRCD